MLAGAATLTQSTPSSPQNPRHRRLCPSLAAAVQPKHHRIHGTQLRGRGSGAGGEWSHQFTIEEADVLYRHHIPVPMEYRLTHVWHMSVADYAVPPPAPDGPELRSLIEEWQLQMMSYRRRLLRMGRCCAR
jgi:hypothetical protein